MSVLDEIQAHVQSIFPVGTSVGLYTDAISDSGHPRPVGEPLIEKVVDAEGNLRFGSLTEDTTYFMGAVLGEEWVMIEVATAARNPKIMAEEALAGVLGMTLGGLSDLSGVLFNPREARYGAKGNGGDDTHAIRAAFEAAAEIALGFLPSTVDGVTLLPVRPTVYIPDGFYMVKEGFRLHPGVNVIFGQNCFIKASQEGEALLWSDANDLLQDQRIVGGRFDCDDKFEKAIDLRYFAHLSLMDVYAYNASKDGITLGNAGSPTTSYEAMLRDVKAWRIKGRAVPEGSRGLVMLAGDSKLEQVMVVDYDVGISNQKGSNHYGKCHVWGYTPPTTCFDDVASKTVYTDCYADTPAHYGWKFHGGGSGLRLVACTAYNGKPTGTDNQAVAINLVEGSPRVYLAGFRVEGVDAEHRWAKVLEGSHVNVRADDIEESNVVVGFGPNFVGQLNNKSGLTIQRSPAGNSAILQWLFDNEAPLGKIKHSGELQLTAGGLQMPIRTVEAAVTTLGTSDFMVLVKGEAEKLVVRLPAIATEGEGLATETKGRIYLVKNIGKEKAIVRVDGGGVKIDFVTELELAKGEEMHFISDGTQWWSL